MTQYLIVAARAFAQKTGFLMALLVGGNVLAQPAMYIADSQFPESTARTAFNRASYEAVTSQRSASPSGIFNSGIIFVADQLDRIYHSNQRSRPTVATTFVNLDNLNETSGLGRLAAEHLMHELQVRSWAVRDIRLTKELVINENGEFSLSRDIKHLHAAYPVANIVTGTYSVTGDGVLLSVRIIDSSSGQVIASAQTRFLRDRFISSLLDKGAKPHVAPTIRLTASCPTNTGCPVPAQ